MQDGNQNPQDSLPGDPQGQSSTGEGGTPAGTTKTYTQSEVDRMLADSGRKWKAKAETLQTQIKAHETNISTLQKQIDEMEDGHFANVPDMAAINRMKRELEANARLLQERTDLERQREDHQSDIEEAKAYKRLKKAQEIAGRYKGVEAEDLVNFTDGSPEKMEAFANKYGKPKEELPKPKTEVPTVKPDSGVTKGGGKPTFTREQIKNRAFWEANREAILLAEKEGRIR